MAGFGQVYERRQTHFQIGDNTNMFDWTYVGNVAHAHLLAADRLVAPTVSYPAPVPAGQPAPEVDVAAMEKLAQSQRQLVASPLPPIGGSRRIPTSNARPIGPAVEPPPNAAEIEAAFHAPLDVKNSKRPVWHNRFDPLSENSLARAAARGENPLQVAGQAFFVTNGEPLYFWDFPRLVWHKLAQAESTPPPKKSTIRFPRELGMVLATAADWWGWLSGKEPAFTRFRVSFSCVNRWHNIEKARRVLGYEPVVSLEEGVDKMVEVSIDSYTTGG
jgi:sterol-4alpha-carboxylate 3-dehydrogenase (decarboxylating)